MTGQPRGRGRPKVETLTDNQRRVLQEMCDFIARHNYPPTMQELGALLGITGASVHQLVKQLERKGYVTRKPRQARSLVVVRRPEQAVETLMPVPLLGVVKAGPAMLAEENRIGDVLVDAGIAGRGRCFALRVSGDSMIDAGMCDGDVVIVRQQPVAESGEVVVALIGDDATVKRLFVSGDQIELRPENKNYKPIVVAAEVDFRILGKVIAVRRNR